MWNALKSVDLWLTDCNDIGSTSNPHPTFGLDVCLESLCLAASNGTGVHYATAINRLLNAKPRLWVKQTALKALTLRGLSLSVLHTSLTRVVEFARLSNLVLWDCAGTHKLLEGITRKSSLMGSYLKLLALNIHPDSEVHIDAPLGMLLGSCTSLTSLCVQWDTDRGYEPKSLLDNISKVGKSLLCLSLHATSEREDDILSSEDFEKICHDCPNLEQLGYRFDEEGFADIMDDDAMEWAILFVSQISFPLNVVHGSPASAHLNSDDRELMSYKGPFTILRNLKILHLRQILLEPSMTYEAPVDEQTRDASTCFKLERVAQKFFQYMADHADCSPLEAFVIGQENRLLSDDECQDYTPLHCYLKAELRDVAGRRRTVASPITSDELRTTTDYADILDWHTGWREPTKRMSRLPGRFNDD